MSMSDRLEVHRVVGVYGVSGAGKSRLLLGLAERRPEWQTVEGSDAIATAMEEHGGGGLEAFKRFESKHLVRAEAIKHIARECNGLTLVAGHFSFPDGVGCYESCFTAADAEVYDAVVYIDHLSSAELLTQREDDVKRSRPAMTASELGKWIEYEGEHLRRRCESAGIEFMSTRELLLQAQSSEGGTARSPPQLIDVLEATLVVTLEKSLKAKESQSHQALLRVVAQLPDAQCYLLIDGDRTMCFEDTSRTFFDMLASPYGPCTFANLQSIFKRHEAYCFQAFAEAAMLYARLPDSEYASHARVTAQSINLYPEFVELLCSLPRCVHAVLVTAGIRELWLNLLEGALKFLLHVPGALGCHLPVTFCTRRPGPFEYLRSFIVLEDQLGRRL